MPPRFQGPRTFRLRIFWSLIPIFLLSFALVAAISIQQNRALVEELLLQRGESIAENLARAVELGVLAEDEYLLSGPTRTATSDEGVSYLAIYSSTGEQLAESRGEASADLLSTLPNAQREAVSATRRLVVHDTMVGDQRVVEFVAPIMFKAYGSPDESLIAAVGTNADTSSQLIGFMRLGLSMRPLDDYMLSQFRIWAVLGILVLVGGGGAILISAARITEMGESLQRSVAEQERLLRDLENANRDLEDRSVQLEFANRHKSEFLANMSHELRTPLNAIIGFSEVLKQRWYGALNDDQAEYVDDIHSSGKHLHSLINDILDLSKIEAGRMELEVATFDLSATLGNASTLVRERAKRHGIELTVKVDPGLDSFEADERKVKQVVLNLLSNAVKFTPEGGTITLSAVRIADGVEIAVSDTGIGISADDRVAVFEEFTQVGDYERKSEGTGLGLTLARKFVELHGGSIWLESEVGKGSRFAFSLPSMEQALEEGSEDGE